MFDKLLENVKKPVYLTLLFVLYLTYFLVVFGIYQINPFYVAYFSKILQIFIASFLIIRFHPFRKHQLNEFDDKIIFGSGLLILSDLGVTSLIENILNDNKNKLMEYIHERT